MGFWRSRRHSTMVLAAAGFMLTWACTNQSTVDEEAHPPADGHSPQPAKDMRRQLPDQMPVSATLRERTADLESINRIIIKLDTTRENAFAGDLSRPSATALSGSSANLPVGSGGAPTGALDHLHAKYGVKRIERVFFRGAAEAALSSVRRRLATMAWKSTMRRPTLDDFLQTYVIELQSADLLPAALHDYNSHPLVEYAHADHRVFADARPNDSDYDLLWGMEAINAEAAWDVTQGAGVVVAVVDTGVDYNHADLVANIWYNNEETAGDGIDNDGNGYVDDIRGWNFCGNNNDPMDDNDVDETFHGTHVAGTIAATGDNNIGVIGVAPAAQLMAVKALDNAGGGSIASTAPAILYAALNGARVINNSWISYDLDPTVASAIETAYALGATLIFGAGNNNGRIALHRSLAGKLETIAVGATTLSDTKASFSNYGMALDVAAPGEDIYSTKQGGGYRYHDGTSMATPHVSGLAALVLAHHPALTNEDVRQVMRSAATDIASVGFDEQTGHGRINANLALQIQYPCNVRITSPRGEVAVEDNNVTITGSASGVTCSTYSLEYAEAVSGPWTLIVAGNPISNGVLGNWDTSELSGQYFLRVSMTNNDGFDFDDFAGPFWVNVPSMFVNLTAATGEVNWTTASVLGDLDRDGQAELIVGSWTSTGGYVHIVFPDGTHLDHHLSIYALMAPAVADIDGDGDGEIITAEMLSSIAVPAYNNVQVFAIEMDGTPVPGWPVRVQGILVNTTGVAVGDVDADGYTEVFVPSSNAFADGEDILDWHHLFAFAHDGTPKAGWPVDYGVQWDAKSTPVLVDLEGDGMQEVLLGVKVRNSTIDEGALLAFRHDGTPVSGFPVLDNSWNWNVTAADLDNDGQMDILTNGLRVDSAGNLGDGTLMWNYGTMVYSTALGYLDEDDTVEAVFSLQAGITVVDHRGRNVGSGWPKDLSPDWPYSNATIVDIDGDGVVEVLLATMGGYVYAWHLDGTSVDGFPLDTLGSRLNEVVVGDFDGDGFTDIVGTGKETVYLWNTLGLPWSANCMDWPCSAGNPGRSGVFVSCPEIDPCTIDAGPCRVGNCPDASICQQLDDACNDGTCNSDTTTCVRAPIRQGESCDDLDPRTVDDVCIDGVCLGVLVAADGGGNADGGGDTDTQGDANGGDGPNTPGDGDARGDTNPGGDAEARGDALGDGDQNQDGVRTAPSGLVGSCTSCSQNGREVAGIYLLAITVFCRCSRRQRRRRHHDT